MSRDDDKRCAEALGLQIMSEAWPCGYAPDCGTYEAALYGADDFDNASGLSRTSPDIIHKVREAPPHYEQALGFYCEPIPAYSTDLAAARLLEDEIERRGLQEQYIEALIDTTNTPSLRLDVWPTTEALWAFTRATPEQRARAFLKAIQP